MCDMTVLTDIKIEQPKEERKVINLVSVNEGPYRRTNTKIFFGDEMVNGVQRVTVDIGIGKSFKNKDGKWCKEPDFNKLTLEIIDFECKVEDQYTTKKLEFENFEENDDVSQGV